MSKRLLIDIDCGNAAFEDQFGGDSNRARRHEAANILREAARRLELGYERCDLRDTNGNKVGHFRFINGRK